MTQFATGLQNGMDRPVIDGTGRAGVFDFDYAYVREDVTVTPDTPVRADLPDLFTALREQLGLRLESQTSDVQVLVIDAASPPSAN